jgi:uncharacterized protein YdeI (YjbR/CyaY-like superfamily)
VRITPKLYVTSRDQWRTWLEKNHDAKKEVWLIYYKKHTAKPTLSYDEAVEEALCFGWIDSVIQRIDDQMYARKFTPRKNKSKWSELNIKRARKMIREGRMTEAELVRFGEIEGKNKSGPKAEPSKNKLVIPLDLKEALSTNAKAWDNFNNFAPSYKKLYVRWIKDAKREETRKKRIKQTIRWAAQNKKPGINMKRNCLPMTQ